MIYYINTPYNYRQRRFYTPNYGKLDVVEVDTSINESMMDSTSPSRQESSKKGQFLENDEPVSLYGNGLTMTEFDPILNKQLRSQSQVQAQAQRTSESSKGASADVAVRASTVNSNVEQINS